MSSPQSPKLLDAAVVSLVGTRGPLSRSDIARQLDVSPATVTAVTKRLLGSGALSETGTVPSDGGRPSTLLDLTTDRRCALGVKITPNHLTMAVVDLVGKPMPATSIDCDMRKPDVMHRIADAIADMAKSHEPLLGIGLAVPGFCTPTDPLSITAPTLRWDRVPLGHELAHRTGLRIVIDNDVNALATADRLYGDHLGSNPLLITIGFGIGSAITVDGEVMHGAHGGAGELGHINVDPDGDACACGLRGCLETVIGDDALVRRARRAGIISDRQGKVNLNRLANAGHAEARELFADAGNMLGKVVANLVHVLDPDLITISGEGVDMWHHWEPGFTTALNTRLPVHRRNLPIVTRPWGEATWAHGAASLVFSLPLLNRKSANL